MKIKLWIILFLVIYVCISCSKQIDNKNTFLKSKPIEYDLKIVFDNYLEETEVERSKINETYHPSFVPIQIKNNHLEYTFNEALYKINLLTYLTNKSQNLFTGFSINQKNFSYFSNPGNWVISDESCYYYLKYSANKEMNAFDLICIDQKTLKNRWTKNIFKQNIPIITFPIKLIQNDKNILVIIRDQLEAFCIDKETGQILWTFDPTNIYKNYMKPMETKSMVQLHAITLEVVYQPQDGIILKLITYDKNTQKNIEKYFNLSWNGKVINILDKELIDFENNQYLFYQNEEYGIANLKDNQILWKKKFQSGNIPSSDAYGNMLYPFHMKSNCLFLIQTLDSVNSLTVFNLESGIEIWSKSITNEIQYIIDVTKVEDQFFLLCANQNNQMDNMQLQKDFLLVWNSINQSYQTLFLGTQSIMPNNNIYARFVYACLMNGNFLLFLQCGWIVFYNSSLKYYPYFTDNSGEPVYGGENCYPIINQYQDRFILSFTPLEKPYSGGWIKIYKWERKE
jgi:hypothetical protein